MADTANHIAAEANWVSIDSYAAHYKVSRAAVKTWIKQDRLRAVRMGSHWRIDLNTTPS